MKSDKPEIRLHGGRISGVLLYKAKTQNRLFYDPSLTHKKGSGGKYEQLSTLFTYGFPIPLNTFSSSRSKNKGDIRGKDEIGYFMTQV